MGMSASQARYLQLTARKSDLEYLAQQICQQRLTLASQTEALATKYNDAMSDRRLFFTPPYTKATALDSEGNANPLTDFNKAVTELKRLDYFDITNLMTDDEQPGLGMRIVNSDGKIVVPAIPAGENPDDYYVEPALAMKSSDGEKAYQNACNILQDKLLKGEWLIQKLGIQTKRDAEGNGYEEKFWSDVSLTAATNIDYKLYTENDSAATAEYEHSTSLLQHEDKMLEMQLQKVETEHKAIETEMDSVSGVIKKNVDNSFKTFSA